MLLRLAMLFNLTDRQLRIDRTHIDAALAWLRLGTATVRYLFDGPQFSYESAKALEIANRINDAWNNKGWLLGAKLPSNASKGTFPPLNLVRRHIKRRTKKKPVRCEQAKSTLTSDM